MAVNAITTSGTEAIPQVGLLPSIIRFIQTILNLAGVDTPDALFNWLSRLTPNPPGLAAAPYVNALRDPSVRMAI